MNLVPLLNAPPVIKLHAFLGMTALMLGTIQFVAPKGTLPHRTLGWMWITLMLVMLSSAFFIHGNLQWGPFNPQVCWQPFTSQKWLVRCAGIHVLTIYLILALPFAVLQARRHNVGHHGTAMVILFLITVVIAGIFTLDTDRIMHAVIFGS